MSRETGDFPCRIPATISATQLESVLEISPVSRQQLLLSRQGQHVSLTVGGDFGLACICGKDEVQAVSEMMTEDQYWIVDLYLSGNQARPY